jgi:hypothetical protein
MALHTSANDLAFEDIESSEQRRCAMAFVVVGHRAGSAFLHRQAGLGAVERLDLRFFVDREDIHIHSKASFYEAFPAAEARRLVERFQWHYTPKHGTWLDLAESELGVLSSQCLDRRIPDKQTLIDEIAAWEHDRNANHAKANWRFTTPNARIKLKHL